jgi:stearoyl-CoA desaturase (Delta-9 desaturase)
MSFDGLLDLPWWGVVLATLALTHITIASVTIFLHRHQAHRALELHPAVSHFFRFWLWLTTGMITKHWAAIHRKHHAKCETTEDPHSPQVLGLKKVLLEGAELYRNEGKNQETLEKYGKGTPDDWLENNIYTPHSGHGIVLMLIIDILLFGPIGITVWAVQMIWIPFFAAGIINGVGHYWGYRNFSADDASTNVVPWGILIGGEELHNNHHAYASSARLSNKWFEFDIGWLYIRIMETLGLAQVKKIAPRVRLRQGKAVCDLDTVQAVLTHRYEVMTRFTGSVKKVCAAELKKLGDAMPEFREIAAKRFRLWLHFDAKDMAEQERAKLDKVLGYSPKLATIYNLRHELAQIWQRSNATKEQLLNQLQDWCRRAEESGIESLRDFSMRLRCYA